MQIYYSNQNGEHCVYVDSKRQSQRIFLPPEIDQLDANWLASSEAANYVIKQLLRSGEQSCKL